MDSRNGDIHLLDPQPAEGFKKKDELKYMIPLTDEQVKELMPLGGRVRLNKMRNHLCICGSNKKFKRCCWSKYE